ncbi:MAG TPA: BtpA/SgcQ family protein [Labilithrix sp.]|jgi:membrane complex biogenesis BtpA family protein|nr:BtpA/SgcQ family protein [Labilithrix sp.]
MSSFPSGAFIAAVHLPPSLSLDGFPGRRTALEWIERDVGAALSGGADAVLLENENDKPHTLVVSDAQVAWLTEVSGFVRRMTEAPVGLNVQRIDWEANLAIAAAAGLDFIRLDVFVDRVRMQGEEVVLRPEEVLAYRAAVHGEAVRIFADVHVKHADLLSKQSIAESARAAAASGADVVIVTGERTGAPPSISDLIAAREGAPLIAIGSGTDAENARSLRAHADIAIVGTSLKEGPRVSSERVRAVASAWRAG